MVRAVPRELSYSSVDMLVLQHLSGFLTYFPTSGLLLQQKARAVHGEADARLCPHSAALETFFIPTSDNKQRWSTYHRETC